MIIDFSNIRLTKGESIPLLTITEFDVSNDRIITWSTNYPKEVVTYEVDTNWGFKGTLTEGSIEVPEGYTQVIISIKPINPKFKSQVSEYSFNFSSTKDIGFMIIEENL